MDRIIGVKVGGNYISKDNKNAGVTGEANVTMLRITFDEGWDSYAKTVTFFDAHGKNPVKRIQGVDLIEDIAKDTRTYITPIPKEPLAIEGEMTFVIDGYLDGKRQRSISAKLVVKYSPDTDNAEEPTDPTPTQTEQLQAQIDIIMNTIQEASIARDEAGDSAESARESAESASISATKAEEAVGKTSYIGENGNWYEWDSSTGAFYDTGVKAQAGSTVYLGDNPPANADVWIDPNGDSDIIDQTYNPESENAQSGKAVAQAINATVGDLSNANEGYFPLNIVEYVNEVETHIGDVAGAVDHLSRELPAYVDNRVSEETALIKADVEGIQKQINEEAHFRGYLSTNAKIQALEATPNDFAYSAESGTKWIYDAENGWQDTGTPVPDQLTPASDATPLMNGTASAGKEETYARGDHRHPTDTTRVSVTEFNQFKSDIVTDMTDGLATKQDKELEWQVITNTTLTEDATFTQKLPDNCVGLRVKIRIPKEIALPAGQLYPRVTNPSTWIYPLYFAGYNANTAQDKLIAAEWTQKHGTWVYDCKARTGAGNYTGSIMYSFPEISNSNAYKYSLSTFPALNEINYNTALKAGTIIKVWGLVK